MILAVAVLLVTISCSRNPNTIFGTWWEIKEQKEISFYEKTQSPYGVLLELFPDGTFGMSGKNELSGKYSFSEQDQIKFEIKNPFGVSMVSKYSLSGNKLFLTIEGRDFTYHRTGTLRPNCDLPACGESRTR